MNHSDGRHPTRASRLTLTIPMIVALAACAGAQEESTKMEGKQASPAAVKVAAEQITATFPGASAYPASLLEQLLAKRAARGADYAPRTRHLRDDGWASYTNRLFLQSSPYLLQHAHNPVNWYPWGDEAFAAARERGVPVLLSIGYSTCHWCHVMEEESFEDPEIAEVMNREFVAIKVDREERPDVDAIYMTAVQAMTGRGGWPMTVFMTPDRKPFFGGTYFPARDGDRGSSVGFLTLLTRMKDAYAAEPEKVVESANQLVQVIQDRLGGAGATRDLPGREVLVSAARSYASRFDATNGGVGGAPKFPSSLPVRFLLRHHRRTGDAKSLEMAVVTLGKMARGGMYDQAAGGFHRYSVDSRWLVPHFEKMLYDNALLTMAYVEGYQATGDAELARIAGEILRYVGRDMTSPSGAFYSATDADSTTPAGHREEGYYFTWTPDELLAVLGEERAELVGRVFRITEHGNFEGRNILSLERPLREIAGQLEIDPDELRTTIDEAREALYEARKSRPQPLRDDKILASWNGLMISAFSRAALALDEHSYAEAAARAADFILTKMRRDGRLLRSFKDDEPRHNAYLDDYAFVIAGLLDLFEATNEPRWLREAIALDAILGKHYEDAAGGGFFMISDDHEELLAREKPAYDGAEPSGNSVAVLNLLRLQELTTSDTYRVRAERALRSVGQTLTQSPAALSEMLLALDFQLDVAKEVVIVTPEGGGGADPLLAELRAVFVPNRVLAVVEEGKPQEELAKLVPWVAGKVTRRGLATAYVCENRVCELPTSDPAVFGKQLRKVEPLTPPTESR